MDAKRGFVPEDEKYFSQDSMEKMRLASKHVCYLLNEGYGLKQATTFVCDHFLLSERQRLEIMRSVAADQQLSERRRKQVPVEAVQGKTVWVDGFNTIITLEVFLSGSTLFACMDDTIRDLASLRGTYRVIPETSSAVKLMFDTLQEAGAGKVIILLDEPVSNSGRLRSLMADIAEDNGYSFDLDIRILRDVDRELYQKEFVITSDSIILDHCVSWVNLTVECMKREGVHAIQIWQAAGKEART